MKANGKDICSLGCPKRDATCHANCEPYLNFYRERVAENEQRIKDGKVTEFVSDSIKHIRISKKASVKHYRPKENR